MLRLGQMESPGKTLWGSLSAVKCLLLPSVSRLAGSYLYFPSAPHGSMEHGGCSALWPRCLSQPAKWVLVHQELCCLAGDSSSGSLWGAAYLQVS